MTGDVRLSAGTTRCVAESLNPVGLYSDARRFEPGFS
jgi:hypothetical protein